MATSAEGCASGECLPSELPFTATATAPPISGFAPLSVERAPTPVSPADDDEESDPQIVVPSFGTAASPRLKDDPTRTLHERWRAAVATVRDASTRHGSSLAHGRILWIRPGDVGIAFTRAAEFHRTMVSTSGRSTVEKALGDHFGQQTRLTIESAAAADAAPPSLAEEEAAVRQQREKGADLTVRRHPAVLAALRILGGEIEHIQVLEPELKDDSAASEPELPDA